MSLRALVTASIVALAVFGGAPDAHARMPAGFWDRTFRIYAHQDKLRSASKHGVLFVGSSSIRLWKTSASFPGLPTVNRGLGGAGIDDLVRHVDRLVFPRQPRLIVFYAGENDIGAGVTPERVRARYLMFVALVRARLPETKMIFISIKPSVLMRRAWPQAREANRLIEELCASDPLLRYVDVATPMLTAEGKPRRELFREDGLHMNPEGYRLWNEILAPIVQEEFAPAP